jgi:hypothetical protein
MDRTRLLPLCGISLSLGILGVVACNGHRTETIPTTSKATAPAPATAPSKADDSKLLSDWHDVAGAIIISGEMIGYLEPCGCTEGQQGGLGRRYDLIERLRAQGWPVVLIDNGSFADPPDARGGPVESRGKFNVALRALTAMQYDAIALSADDLKQGILESLSQYLNLGEKPKVVAANVAPEQGLEAAVKPSVRTTAGPIKVGVTAVLDPESYNALNDPEKPRLTVKDPQESLKAVLADLEKDTDVQILMVQAAPKKAKQLAQAFPGFDLVVSTSDVVDPDGEPEMLNDGKTFLVQVGKKGKYVGMLGLFQDPKQKLRYKRITLDRRFKNAEPMQKLIGEEFQSELKALKVVEDFPRHDYIGGAEGATFIGAENCKGCHPTTYARWASTKHAQGFEALLKPERNREFDAECINCHTTGFGYTSGFRSAELTPHLKGNQCENCHGPGSKHAAEPDQKEYRALLTQPVANPDQNHFCYRCHDEDNDPHFDFTKRYGEIIHKAMDKYDDPKVHQGIKPNVPAAAP